MMDLLGGIASLATIATTIREFVGKRRLPVILSSLGVFLILGVAGWGVSSARSSESQWDKWTPVRPAPNRVTKVDNGILGALKLRSNDVLRYKPVHELDWALNYNQYYRVLPSQRSDLDVVIKFSSQPSPDHNLFWINLTKDLTPIDKTATFFEAGISYEGNAAVIYSYIGNGGVGKQGWEQSQASLKAIPTNISGDIYLKISRRQGNMYSSYYSYDGRNWNLIKEPVAVNELLDFASFAGTSNRLASSESSQGDYVVDIYWVHFNVVKNQ